MFNSKWNFCTVSQIISSTVCPKISSLNFVIGYVDLVIYVTLYIDCSIIKHSLFNYTKYTAMYSSQE